VSVDLTVPDWLHRYILAWVDRLALNDWRVKVTIALCVNDDPDTHALCHQQPDLNEASLTFRVDIEDTKEWRITVIHELIHVRHSRIDHAVERVMIPELASAAQQPARELYHQHVESFTAYIARTLYCATVALDYPEEPPP
jgi:hypothetical protein